MKNLMFLSGLPRTGSTLLTSLLNQHPEIYASGSSALQDLIFKTDLTLQELDKVYAIPMQRKLNLYGALIDSFYKDIDKKLIIDKHRGWIKNFAGLNTLYKNPKVIFTIRPVSDVIASYLKLVEKNNKIGKSNFIDEDLKTKNIECNNDNRAKYIWHMITEDPGGPLHNLKPIVDQYRDNIIFVQYDDLVNDTKNTLNKVLDFCDIELYENFDLNNIINTNPELDEHGWGMYGLHDIRKTLGKESIPLKHYLSSPSLVEFFDKVELPK
jgi:sulfotransferase